MGMGPPTARSHAPQQQASQPTGTPNPHLHLCMCRRQRRRLGRPLRLALALLLLAVVAASARHAQQRINNVGGRRALRHTHSVLRCLAQHRHHHSVPPLPLACNEGARCGGGAQGWEGRGWCWAGHWACRGCRDADGASGAQGPLLSSRRHAAVACLVGTAIHSPPSVTRTMRPGRRKCRQCCGCCTDVRIVAAAAASCCRPSV